MFYKIIMVLPFIIINIPDSLGYPLVIKVISLLLIQDYIIDWIELGQEDRTQKDMKIDIPHFPGLLISRILL